MREWRVLRTSALIATSSLVPKLTGEYAASVLPIASTPVASMLAMTVVLASASIDAAVTFDSAPNVISD